MTELLPTFSYHRDPTRTGVFAESKATCRACERSRGWIYTGPVYGSEDLDDAICPWCIADGTAARKFDASFCDDHSLVQAGLSAEIVEEVSTRTPGYVSWQSEYWASHCGDACAFAGDMPKAELEADAAAQAWLAQELHLTEVDLRALVMAYQPGGQPAVYVFLCRRCGTKRYHVDFA